MNLHHRHVDTFHSIVQRVGVVRVRPGVVHDAVVVAMGRMQPIDERALMVRLEAVDLAAMLGPVIAAKLTGGVLAVLAALLFTRKKPAQSM